MFFAQSTKTTVGAQTFPQSKPSRGQRGFRRWQAAIARERKNAPDLDPIAAVRRCGRVRMPVWAAEIVVDVAGRHKLDPMAIMSKSRAPQHVHARYEALYLIRASHPTFTPSFPRIADWFGREHTSVLWAVGRHSAMTGAPKITGLNVDLGMRKRRARNRRLEA